MSKKKNRQQDGYVQTYNFRSNQSTILGIDFSKNPEQQELIRLMNDKKHPIIFCIGDAGTGKTFTAVATAVDLVKVQKKYSKIFYIREPLEVGKSLGFLPGELSDKYGVYLDGLSDNIEHISEFSGINPNDMKSCIECIPPQFIRGRSFENSILILDESQNLTLDTIQAICTRLGKYCKAIFMGSLNQIDLKGKTRENNDFKTAYEIINNIPEDICGYVELIKSERSEYCQILDRAFTEYKEKNKL